MHRQSQHRAPDIGQAAGVAVGQALGQGAERAQQRLGLGHGVGVRLVEPVELGGFVDAGGVQHQHRPRQIGAVDFRRVVPGAIEVAALGPKPVARSRRGAAGAAGALVGGGAADLLDQQRAKAALGVEAGDAGHAAVDHVTDAVDGHRGLGDVGGDNDFSAVAPGEGAILIGRWEVAVQRDQLDRLRQSATADRADSAANFAHSRHKNQNIAGRVVAEDLLDGLGSLLRDGIAIAILAEANLDRKGAPVGGEHAAGIVIRLAKVAGDRAGLNRRRHDDKLEVGASGALQFFDEAKREVAHQVALVKLVEQHRADAGQARVVLQSAQQHALGDELDFGFGAGVVFEANLIADFVAEPGRAFPRDAPGERAGGDAARLQHDDFTAAAEDVVEDDFRDLCGFARAGRRGKDEAVLHGERVGDLAVDVPDGERLVHAACVWPSVGEGRGVKAGGPVFRAWS